MVLVSFGEGAWVTLGGHQAQAWQLSWCYHLSLSSLLDLRNFCWLVKVRGLGTELGSPWVRSRANPQ